MLQLLFIVVLFLVSVFQVSWAWGVGSRWDFGVWGLLGFTCG